MILFGILIVFAPVAASGLFNWTADTISQAFTSIGIFLDNVVPKK